MSVTFSPDGWFPGSWLPVTVWFDDLDVLGSDVYQLRPGPHLDEGMEPAWRMELFEALHERDLVTLLFYARGFALLGYPFGAQALRNRAAALGAWMEPSVPLVVQEVVRKEFELETRAESLVGAARWCEGHGYGSAGYALRDRAALLKVARRRKVAAPEIVGPWGARR